MITACCWQAVLAGSITESGRSLPVAGQVDVVVVGGNTWAVAAAVSATEKGAKVFLAAPRPYLGEDLCGTLRLSLAEGQTADDPLAREVFGNQRSTTPLRIKKALDDALVKAKVEFLFGCYPTDVLYDAEQKPAGIVIANRAGRQAIIAKIIVDATDRASVARMAGAPSATWNSGDCGFARIVIMPDDTTGGKLVEHALKLPMPDGGFCSFVAAEQLARDKTYADGQLRASESLFLVPPDPIVGQKSQSRWRAEKPDLGHFRPQGIDRLYVISGCADMPRPEAARLLRPTGLMQLGRRIGLAAARDALAIGLPCGVRLPGKPGDAAVAGDIRESLSGPRSTGQPRAAVNAPSREVPVLGEFDVVVVGGGTSGAPAAIAAARQGARTVVIEYQEGLGGIGTLGLIGRPYHGKDIGFTREVPFPDAKHGVEHKMEWYRREIRKAGGDIWLGALGCGTFVEDNRVRGAVVATPQGRGVVLAKVVIDATGNADLAAAAGVETMYGDEEGDIALQGTGLPTRPLGSSFVNSDYLLVEEADMLDVWAALVGARQAMKPSTYDAGTLIQNRERRRIVGEHVLRYLDQVIGRTYPDTVVFSESDYDSHGYPSGMFFALLPHDEKSRKANHPAIGGACYTPYRCLLPKGLDGLLVVGLGMSMERDASAMVRMQRDLQNQGYAAGVAAAMAAQGGRSPRDIDIRALQKHLVSVGNLPAEVLEHRDNFPLEAGAVATAVRAMVAPGRLQAAKALAVVLAHRQTALPLLKEAFSASTGDDKLGYAKILGFLGQPEAVPTLIQALEAVSVWDAKIFQGVAAEYAHLPTPVDALILALGYAGDRRAVPSLLKMLQRLDTDTTLSHHRAVALALERIGDPSAAEPLARLLERPGMRGHAMRQLEPLYSDRDRRRREGAIREIVLARALYRCRDARGLGARILDEYRHDLRGLFARHAENVLQTAERR